MKQQDFNDIESKVIPLKVLTPEAKAKERKRRTRKHPDNYKLTVYDLGFTDSTHHLYLIQSYNKKDGIKEAPRGLVDLLLNDDKPIAFTTYKGFGGKRGSVTSYLGFATQDDLVAVARKSNVRIDLRKSPATTNPEFDQKYNISSEHIDVPDVAGHLSESNKNLNEKFVNALRHDIGKFCGEKPGKPLQGTKGFVPKDKLDRERKIILIEPRKDMVLTGKGITHPICDYDMGIDIGRGCLAGLRPDGTYAPHRRCSFCYAEQNFPDPLTNMFSFTEQSLIADIKAKAKRLGIPETLPLVLRLGQRIEMSFPKALREQFGFEDGLKKVLRAIEQLSYERKIRTVLPTRVPDFDTETIDLLKRSNTTVLISIAYQKLEPGIVDWGFDVERRLKEEYRLVHEGVNTGRFIATDFTRSRIYAQDDIKIVEDWDAKYPDLNVFNQYIEARITKKRDAIVIGGAPWYVLKNRTNKSFLDDETIGEWKLTKQSYLAPAKIHQDFLDLVGKKGGHTVGRNRLCAVELPEGEQHCGHCGIERIARMPGYQRLSSRAPIYLKQV